MLLDNEKTKLYNRLNTFITREVFEKLIADLKGTRRANADSYAELRTKLKERKKDIAALNKTVASLVTWKNKVKAKKEKVRVAVKRKKDKKITSRFQRAINVFLKNPE